MIVLTDKKYAIAVTLGPRNMWAQSHDLKPVPLMMPAAISDQAIVEGEFYSRLHPKPFIYAERRNDGRGPIDLDSEQLTLPPEGLYNVDIMGGEGKYQSHVMMLRPGDEGGIKIVNLSMRIGADKATQSELLFTRALLESYGYRTDVESFGINPKFILGTDYQLGPDFLQPVNYAGKLSTDPRDFGGWREVMDNARAAHQALNSPEPPEGPDYCQELDDPHLPPNHIFQLPRVSTKMLSNLEPYNTTDLKKIPEDAPLTAIQSRMAKAVRESSPFTSQVEIAKWLGTIADQPVHYLDFETLATAVPIYPGIRPYQQCPFQFALLTDDGEAHSFLADAGSPAPHRDFIDTLARVLPPKGAVVAYNSKFEVGVLRDMGRIFPEHEEFCDKTIGRMVDLHVPFRTHAFYHQAQKGSSSMKAVLPALTGTSYEDMGIGNGIEAAQAFHDMATRTVMSNQEIEEVRKNLEVYCIQDTSGMKAIVDSLNEIVVGTWKEPQSVNQEFVMEPAC